MNQQFGRLGSPLSIALIGIGLLVIGIGANGVRSNDTLIEQMPYFITGGMVGLAFVIFGSAYMLVQNARVDRTILEQKLDELVAVMAAGGTVGTRTSAAPVDTSGLLVAGTSSYHVPGCRLVDGREEVSYVTAAEALAADLNACRVCRPEGAQTHVTVR